MADAKQQLAEQLALLREEFRRSLPSRLADIVAALAEFTSQRNAAALTAVHAAAHRLAGAAGTFGMPALSAQASEIETTALALTARPVPVDAAAVSTLQSLVDRLSLLSTQDPAPEPAGQLVLPAQAGDPRRVFLVDDDLAVGQEIAKSLALYGYQVTIFEHPNEMLKALPGGPPAALILDLMFPDGLLDIGIVEAARAFAAVPVIFISARGDLNARLHAVRGHCDAYLAKPVDIATLIDRLDLLTRPPGLMPWRVLLVDDDAQFCRSCAAILKSAGIAVDALNEPGKLLERLNEFHPDLIVMDVYLPDCRGDELVRVVRQFDAWQGIPIVYLSAETDRNRQLRGLESGGDDFLTKPVAPDELLRTVIARIQRTQRLRAMMTRDSLTGLLNHVRFIDQLEIEVARARRDQRPLAVAMLDIDHFKSVNDRFGHPAGDAVIKSVARLLLQRLRKVDVIGRYGGEEFAVALPDTELAAAVRVFDDVRQWFSEQRFGRIGGDFSVTLSVGFAALEPNSTPRQLIDRADQALYRAKTGGRNQVVAAAPEAP